MQTKELKSKGLVREYQVTIPAADIESAIESQLKTLAKKAKIDGFRPGKAPFDVIKKRYESQVVGDALEQMISESANKLIDENKFRVALKPKLKVEKFERGQDVEYNVELELLPEIKPVDFATIKLQKLTAEPDEKAINETLQQIAATHTSGKKIEENRASKMGDILVIDFAGTVNGVAHKGMDAKGYELELGSKSFIDTFEEQLVGLKAGAEKDVSVKFPENYGAKELAGKPAVFKVTVHEIKEKALPEINDDFAKKIGFENVDALKKGVKEHIVKEYEQLTKMKLKRSLLDILDEKHNFEVPPSLVDMEFDAIWKRFEENKQRGMLEEDEKKKSEEDLKKEYKKIAVRRVKLALLLAEVSSINKLAVSKEEISRAIYSEAMKYQVNPKEIFDFYQKNPYALEQVKAPLLEEKAINFIIELADTKEKAVSIEELLKE